MSLVLPLVRMAPPSPVGIREGFFYGMLRMENFVEPSPNLWTGLTVLHSIAMVVPWRASPGTTSFVYGMLQQANSEKHS